MSRQIKDLPNLHSIKWGEFFIQDVAKISSGKRLTRADMLDGNTPFIGSTDSNNGITAFVSNTNSSLDSNVLGVNYNGSVVENFFHPYPALFSDDVKRLTLRFDTPTAFHYLFVKNAILQQKSKYQYAYKFNEKRLKRQKIMLPVGSDKKEPNWDFMSSFMKNIWHEKLSKYLRYCQLRVASLEYRTVEKLTDKVWREFFLKDVFDVIQRGKRLTKSKQVSGIQPYISSTALNNGVDNFIGNMSGVRIFSNCLTIANSGSVGSTFYHPYSFVASDHVTHLKNESFNRFVYLFVATQISKLASKYNFNREINDRRISRDKVMLPTNESGEPDYDYMAQFMMNLEYEKRKKYLKYAKSKIVK